LRAKEASPCPVGERVDSLRRKSKDRRPPPSRVRSVTAGRGPLHAVPHQGAFGVPRPEPMGPPGPKPGWYPREGRSDREVPDGTTLPRRRAARSYAVRASSSARSGRDRQTGEANSAATSRSAVRTTSRINSRSSLLRTRTSSRASSNRRGLRCVISSQPRTAAVRKAGLS
jgi:hypothetical protein